MDFAGVFGYLYNLIGGLGITIAILIGGAFAMWGGLVMRRNRKLNKNVLEMYDLGDGRFDFRLTKGGWFGQKLTLAGLWDYGTEDLFRLKDKTPVFDVSHNDYREVNGRSGIVVVRSPNDPKFAIPVSKFFLSYKNDKGQLEKAEKALAVIAPVDLRNCAVNMMELTHNEMRTSLERWMPIIAFGTIAIIVILVTIFNTQYGKHMVDKSVELLKDVTIAVANQGKAIASTAP